MNGFGALGQFALGEGPEGTATVAVYGINYEFSQPVRTPRRLNAALNQTLAFVPPQSQGMGWFAPLSEPVRYPKQLPTPSQMVFAFQPFPVITIGWYSALSEPVRFPKRLPAAEHQFYTAEPEPEDLDVMGWYRPLSEPVRHPQRLYPANNVVFVRGTAPFYRASARGYVIC